MKLILYRHPFIDETTPGRIRILFEAEKSEEPDDRGPYDCYCYVWVEEGNVVAGFQVILDHEYIIEYRPARELLYGLVGKLTLGRSISRLNDSARRRWMRDAASLLESESFPVLTAGMEQIIRTGRPDPLTLTEEERGLLARLVRRSQKH